MSVHKVKMYFSFHNSIHGFIPDKSTRSLSSNRPIIMYIIACI